MMYAGCGAGKQVLKCLLSPDVRQLATASADKTIKLWNLDGFTLDRTLTGEPLRLRYAHQARAIIQYVLDVGVLRLTFFASYFLIVLADALPCR